MHYFDPILVPEEFEDVRGQMLGFGQATFPLDIMDAGAEMWGYASLGDLGVANPTTSAMKLCNKLVARVKTYEKKFLVLSKRLAALQARLAKVQAAMPVAGVDSVTGMKTQVVPAESIDFGTTYSDTSDIETGFDSTAGESFSLLGSLGCACEDGLSGFGSLGAKKKVPKGVRREKLIASLNTRITNLQAEIGRYQTLITSAKDDLNKCLTAAGSGTPTIPGTLTASPSGASMPPESQIVDAQGFIWRIYAGDVYKISGSAVAPVATKLTTVGNVILLLTYNGSMFYKNPYGIWFQWNGSSWVQISGDPRGATSGTPGATASAPGTAIPPAVQIVDNGGGMWTLSGGVIYRNNIPAGSTGLTILVLWYNNTIYQQITSGSWSQWDGYSNWIPIPSDPRIPNVYQQYPPQYTPVYYGSTSSYVPSPYGYQEVGMDQLVPESVYGDAGMPESNVEYQGGGDIQLPGNDDYYRSQEQVYIDTPAPVGVPIEQTAPQITADVMFDEVSQDAIPQEYEDQMTPDLEPTEVSMVPQYVPRYAPAYRSPQDDLFSGADIYDAGYEPGDSSLFGLL